VEEAEEADEADVEDEEEAEEPADAKVAEPPPPSPMPSSPLPFLFDAAIQFSQRFFGAGEKATAPAATVDSVAEVPRAYKLPPKAKKAPKVEAPAAAAPSADVPSADAPSAETAELVADAAALRAEVEADAAGAFHSALDVSTRPSPVGTGASPQPTPLPAFRAAVAAAVTEAVATSDHASRGTSPTPTPTPAFRAAVAAAVAEAVTTMQAEAAASIAKLEARLVDAEAEAKRAREAEAAALARLATSPATLQPSTPERAPPDQSLLGAAIDEAPPATPLEAIDEAPPATPLEATRPFETGASAIAMVPNMTPVGAAAAASSAAEAAKALASALHSPTKPPAPEAGAGATSMLAAGALEAPSARWGPSGPPSVGQADRRMHRPRVPKDKKREMAYPSIALPGIAVPGPSVPSAPPSARAPAASTSTAPSALPSAPAYAVNYDEATVLAPAYAVNYDEATVHAPAYAVNYDEATVHAPAYAVNYDEAAGDTVASGSDDFIVGADADDDEVGRIAAARPSHLGDGAAENAPAPSSRANAIARASEEALATASAPELRRLVRSGEEALATALAAAEAEHTHVMLDERRLTSGLLAEQARLTAALRDETNRLKAKEYVARQQVREADAARVAAAHAARRVLMRSLGSYSRRPSLLWVWSMLRANVNERRQARDRTAHERHTRTEAFSRAQLLASSALPRAARRTSRLFVLLVLKTNVRQRRAERCEKPRHFAADTLAKAEEEKRQAAALHAAAVAGDERTGRGAQGR